ncbi:DUF5694 domain-containing protein [Alkalihalobacillus sp. CinArs1]|uniref:DUF5694 domain-containing protein n=1 Tax=Alkalihalobacillus sp. CinArs1 TaxID=2995314 RepID=UPI0022DDFE2E|nr:DUF5694 domain-containing protein [Alkalihalobacillus sp. CinArs1]
MGKPKVLVFGTFHMKYTKDLYKVDTDDLETEKRQAEMTDVVDRLKRFEPTKLAFEIVKSENAGLNQEYKDYVNGNGELRVDEVHQLGFRIASQLEHKKVYAVDWMDTVGNRALSEVYDWAKEEQPELYEYINKTYRSHSHKSLENRTILELLHEMNSPEEVMKNHEMYMNIARIGKDEQYVGIDWVRWWYQRNLIIYHNLAELCEPGARTLLIIGSAHVHLVSQFLEESGLVEVERVGNYLE